MNARLRFAFSAAVFALALASPVSAQEAPLPPAEEEDASGVLDG